MLRKRDDNAVWHRRIHVTDFGRLGGVRGWAAGKALVGEGIRRRVWRKRSGHLSLVDGIQRGIQPALLALVVAVSTYWIFYGPGRDLNVAGAILLALSLFSVRKHYRTTYGIIEIELGVFSSCTRGGRGEVHLALDFSGDFDTWKWLFIFSSVRRDLCDYPRIRQHCRRFEGGQSVSSRRNLRAHCMQTNLF